MKRLSLFALLVVGFVLLTAPTAVEYHPLTINGKLIGNMVVIQGGTQPGAANAVVVQGGIWAISLEDLSRAMGSPVTLEPSLQLQGNQLFVREAASSAMKYKENNVALKFVTPPSPALKFETTQKIKVAPGQFLGVRRAGLVSSHVLMMNGKAFVPVNDLLRAIGGGSRGLNGNLQPGQGLSLNFTKQQNNGIIAILIGL